MQIQQIHLGVVVDNMTEKPNGNHYFRKTLQKS